MSIYCYSLGGRYVLFFSIYSQRHDIDMVDWDWFHEKRLFDYTGARHTPCLSACRRAASMAGFFRFSDD